MRAPHPEAQLICAVLNTSDLETAKQHGVAPEHFTGFRSEWEWLHRYVSSYHDLPSTEIMCESFPDFPYRSSVTEVPWFADQVIERFNQRNLNTAIMGAAEALSASRTEDAAALLRAVTLSAPTTAGTDAARSFIVADELDREEHLSVAYPWQPVQAQTGGMRPGDFVTVAARINVGKSWALAYAAADAAIKGHEVAFYSLEMPTAQVVARLHVLWARMLGEPISHSQLHQRTVDRIQYKRLLAKISSSVGGTVDVFDSGSGRITPARITANARRYDLVCVDYLGLMGTDGGNRAVEDWRHAAVISNSLKEAAINTGSRIMAASQINRAGALGQSVPGLRDLAQTDAIGQDSDVVLTMRRVGEGPAMRYGMIKNRHGLSGVTFFTRFDPDTGRFSEISEELAQNLADDAAD